MRALPRLLAFGLLLAAPTVSSQAQTSGASSLPRVVEQDGRFALMVDGAPFLMLGAQVNNSSAWPSVEDKVWPTLDALHINTVEAPVYWEEMEREPGKFDFAQADGLLAAARKHNVRLVLLWFGTWKNGSGHYIPQWMKHDEEKFPHVVNEKGRRVDSLSPHSAAALALDKRAFTALMRRLKAADPQHTVIMVQVENESGTYGAVRDHSPAADALFAADVPAAALKAMGKQSGGSWSTVFGEEAPGFFHAWSVASYIEQVAAAGKAEYPLPMYANAALRSAFHPGKQGTWESGAPTDDVFALWKAAAPHIDILAPDIYTADYASYLRYLELYGFSGNALMVPETGRSPDFARFCFVTIGRGGLGWAPFGMDLVDRSDFPAGSHVEEIAHSQFAYNFEALRPIDGMLARLNFEGKLKGSAENPADETHTERLSFGKWTAVIAYGMPLFGDGMKPKGNQPASGEALIAQLGPDEFLVTAYNARVEFEWTDKSAGKQRQWLAVEEGTYTGETWRRSRIVNGDQSDYGLNFQTQPRLLKVTLATY